MFDMTAPSSAGIGQLARHIVNDDRNRIYRHLLRSAYDIVSGIEAGKFDPKFARAILSVKPSQGGAAFETCMSNQRFLRSIKTQQMMVSLYADATGKLRPGFDDKPNAANGEERGKGGLRRFAKVIVPRFQENFDIDRMEMSHVVEAWGDELTSSKFNPDAPSVEDGS